jgi:hypothetical protein
VTFRGPFKLGSLFEKIIEWCKDPFGAMLGTDASPSIM